MAIVRPFGPLPELKREELNEGFRHYVWIEKLFNEQEVERIRNLWDDDTAKNAKLNRSGNRIEDEKVRKSKVMFIKPEDNGWIYDRLAVTAIRTNALHFKFDITGFQTELQLASYGDGDFFAWHLDYGPHTSSNRKLSISIQLSAPEEYTGGDFEFQNNHAKVYAPKTLGTAIIFPSFVPHRVLPVTSGTRMSVVGWIAGPPYR
jgi:PKHD-type hydroxylase